MDPRVKELSRVLTGYSCDLKKGEKVLIDYENAASLWSDSSLKTPTSWVRALT